ncbi:hypothetical protein [Krasilnikovia sp. M28-CT-15]|uniref:hypothetical protein n=1 Tax=Krasilnikovia sp. M28-CT-15 TaxID=3373540 RepID=UPI003876E34C
MNSQVGPGTPLLIDIVVNLIEAHIVVAQEQARPPAGLCRVYRRLSGHSLS